MNNPFCGILKSKNPVFEKNEKNRKKYGIYTKYQFLSSNWITRKNYYCQTTYLISITKRSVRFVSSFFTIRKIDDFQGLTYSDILSLLKVGMCFTGL